MRDDFIKLETNFGITDYINPRKINCIRKSTKDNKFIVELFFEMGGTKSIYFLTSNNITRITARNDMIGVKNKMKRMFISMPMKDKPYLQLVEERNKIARNYIDQHIIIDSISDEIYTNTKDNAINIPVRYLADSIKQLSIADVVLFAKGWEDARGCKIEHEIAKQYGIEIMYEV